MPHDESVQNKVTTISDIKSIQSILGIRGASFCVQNQTLAMTIFLASIGSTISYTNVGGLEGYFNNIFKVVESMFHKVQSASNVKHDLNNILI
jgi:hypothetical protein